MDHIKKSHSRPEFSLQMDKHRGAHLYTSGDVVIYREVLLCLHIVSMHVLSCGIQEGLIPEIQTCELQGGIYSMVQPALLPWCRYTYRRCACKVAPLYHK